MSLKRQPFSLKDDIAGYRELNVTKGPFTVKTGTGLEIKVDAYNNVTIVGQNSFKFKCEGDMEFEADNISMRVKDTHRIESEKHIIQKAARIDFNPLDESNLEIPQEGLDYIQGKKVTIEKNDDQLIEEAIKCLGKHDHA